MRSQGAKVALLFTRSFRKPPLRTSEQLSRWISTSSSRVFSGSSFEKGKWKNSDHSGVFYMNGYPKRYFHGTRPVSVRDYYDVLGVSKNATSSDIKKAYYALAKKLHPDTNKDDAEAERKFQEVSRAYEVLKDDEKRSLYDQVGPDAFEQAASGGAPGGGPYGGGGFNPFEDLFSGFAGGGTDFFKNMFHRDFGGQDIKVPLEISFMEAVQGCTKTLKFQAAVPCEACGGSGAPPGTKPETCRGCRGSGMTFMQQGPFRVQRTCSVCGGDGKIIKNLCKSCGGQKVVLGTKSVRLDVMPGVDNDDTIKIHRSGGADPEGGQPGDLYVTIKVREDPVFRRERSDIHVDAVLNVSQAILGGTIQVPTLTGDVVLKVRPGTQPGQKVVLKGKGIRTRSSAVYGDQFVHFNVSIPNNLTQRQRALIEEFAKEEQGEYDKGEKAAGASG
ncbi:uncharacterized protein A4U43_C01F11860 [Asparagus officinalis]|uniref:J domain-containing protein n=1 Tax=Asparagus officinalis TaxID=4686 RepID=A0A5P1FQC2_ASPOF|nr:chaperone protein dnaJ GFA2, mitochondrial-like [Asparagus officinalis]ONK79923.1 uncharacterized protein A4U43_C01F11860 [Asparagus officinalis]